MSKYPFVFLLLAGCGFGGSSDDSGVPTVTMTANSFGGGGTLAISGTVEFPSSVESGRAIQLELDRTAGTGGGTQLQGGVVTTSAHEVRYVITGLPSGDYQIRVAIDQTNDGFFGGTGDVEGWYDGTQISPIQNQGAATLLTLVSVSRSDIDFGIDQLP